MFNAIFLASPHNQFAVATLVVLAPVLYHIFISPSTKSCADGLGT